MKIEDNSVVRFHYTVTESGQDKLESSREAQPLSILVGHGNIIPGLERALEGHEAGDHRFVALLVGRGACCVGPRPGVIGAVALEDGEGASGEGDDEGGADADEQSAKSAVLPGLLA